ncbi:CBF1-interacting co-repressor CIR N-terminal Pre-mRNA splicing factor [Euphorbia peplus]|nr:CBF1-interacting co-repressor CIR N-terminal Pre-mRNA splicing factor [Euphorbia peplus]
MALKFLNKKGWHTGSLRNIENVWKAEQKNDAEQKKLEELRKQIHQERERSEFRLIQERAGLVPRQERLEFLYDSGLAVGKGSTSSAGGSGVAFQTLDESTPNSNKTNDASSSSAKQPSAPGALFEDKPQSANDAWRKLHSDPLLLIRQREQEALARIKNNPVQMERIRKSAEATKEEKSDSKREHRKKHGHGSAKHHKHSPSKEQLDLGDVHADRENRRRDKSQGGRSKHDDHYYNARGALDENSSEMESQRRNSSYRGSGNSSEMESQRRNSSYRGSSNRDDQFPNRFSDSKAVEGHDKDSTGKNSDKLKREKHSFDDQRGGKKDTEHKSYADRKYTGNTSSNEVRSYNSSTAVQHDSRYKRHKVAPKLSEEERLAKLQEMQVDAQLHEEQRWKRLRRAEEEDVQEAARASVPGGGKNFLDAVQRNVYGAEKGGSSTIEESVRRRAYYSQGRSETGDGNAFRR